MRNGNQYYGVLATVICLALVRTGLAQQAPSCESTGQEALCKIQCASTCRGYKPGFAVPGCAVAEYCAGNVPPWAVGSLCTCVPPAPSPPSPSYPICSNNVAHHDCTRSCTGLKFALDPAHPAWSGKDVCAAEQCAEGSPYVNIDDFGCSATPGTFNNAACCDTRLCHGALHLGGRKALQMQVAELRPVQAEPVCTTCDACCHSYITPGEACLKCEETQCPHDAVQ